MHSTRELKLKYSIVVQLESSVKLKRVRIHTLSATTALPSKITNDDKTNYNANLKFCQHIVKIVA